MIYNNLLELPSGPDDYNPAQADLTFSGSFRTACTSLLVINDQLYEGDESFFASLTTSDSAVTLNPQRATIIINDDNCT